MKWIRNLLAAVGRHLFTQPTPRRPRPEPPAACSRLSAHTQGGAVVVFVATSASDAVKLRLSPAQADQLWRQLRAAVLAVAVLDTITTETQA